MSETPSNSVRTSRLEYLAWMVTALAVAAAFIALIYFPSQAARHGADNQLRYRQACIAGGGQINRGDCIRPFGGQ